MAKTTDNYDACCLPDVLPTYYKRLFPYGPYYRWLSYGGVPKSYFPNREFSFTLKDDVYIRYQSFIDQQDMEREIQKKCPYKIDIGAVFSHRPKDQKTIQPTAFQAVEKELVFDIDMTDYDDVRSCCSGADICDKCWPLMAIAVKILHRALRDDFGFQHILWVYSGRRGIHCWVCDEVARKLSQVGRSAIAEYLSLIKGGENQKRKVHLEKFIHPSISKAIEIIAQKFEDYAVQDQDFMASEQQWRQVLDIIPTPQLQEKISKGMETKVNSSARWGHLKLFISRSKDDESKNLFPESHKAIEEIMLQYCYPRLDVNVSKGINHLLKSPFCIHPKTGRVCVPLDPDKVDNFSPASVPTITQLLEELNEAENRASDESSKRLKEYKRTSLATSIEVFENFVKKLESSWHLKRIEKSDKSLEF